MAKLHSEKRIKAVDSAQAEGAAASFEAGDVIYDSNGYGGFKKKNGALGGGSWDAVGGGGSGASEAFKTITLDGSGAGSVSGDANIVADGATDTLTLAAGSNITLTGTAGSDTILIEASGGGATNLSPVANGTSLTVESSTGNNASLPAATTSAWGVMTDEDKTKLDGIATGAEENVIGWTVVNNSSSSYRFTGQGVVNTDDNPTLYVKRGQKYKFTKAGASHPFRIATNAPASAAYSDGITGNDLGAGTLTWEVRMDAPSELMYYCTSHAGAMKGKIVVVDELQVLSHRQSFSADAGSPEIFDIHSRIFNSTEPRVNGGRIVIDTTNLGNNAGDKVQLDLSELYHPDHLLPTTMNFEVYSVGAAAFVIDVLNPAGGPATGQKTLQSDVSSDIILNEDATGQISVGSGQYVIIYCDGASWYYEKRSGL